MESYGKGHIGEERLEAYATHALAGDELDAVEDHLLVCVVCQDNLEKVERFDRAMQGAAKRIREEQAAVPDRPSIWDWLQGWLRTPAPIWAGAVAMLAIVLTLGLRVSERPGPPVDVELQAVRGSSAGVALAGHSLHLLLDNRGVTEKAAWQVEIVDEDGAGVWSGTGAWTESAIKANVEKAFPAGTYFVRLKNDSPDPVREYQLVVAKAP